MFDIELFQYQSHFEPVLPPAAAEVVTADKFYFEYPQPDRGYLDRMAQAAITNSASWATVLPGLPPPPAPTPLPGAGNSKPFVPRDPTVDRRHRMFQDVVSEVLNSLLGTAQLVQTGAKTYKLAGTEFIADRAPNANDDDTIGVLLGSRWIDTVADSVWINVNNSTGAAVWVGPLGGGAGFTGPTGDFYDTF